MYENGTILKRRELLPPEDPQSAYNFIEVMGLSPSTYANLETWTGAEARGVVVQATFDPDTEDPTPFSPTLDEPVGKLNELYEIVKEPPVVEPDLSPQVRRAPNLPTPNEVFAELDRATRAEKQERAAQFTPSKLTPEQQFRAGNDNDTGRVSTFPPAQPEEAADVEASDQ